MLQKRATSIHIHQSSRAPLSFPLQESFQKLVLRTAVSATPLHGVKLGQLTQPFNRRNLTFDSQKLDRYHPPRFSWSSYGGEFTTFAQSAFSKRDRHKDPRRSANGLQQTATPLSSGSPTPPV